MACILLGGLSFSLFLFSLKMLKKFIKINMKWNAYMYEFKQNGEIPFVENLNIRVCNNTWKKWHTHKINNAR